MALILVLMWNSRPFLALNFFLWVSLYIFFFFFFGGGGNFSWIQFFFAFSPHRRSWSLFYGKTSRSQISSETSQHSLAWISSLMLAVRGRSPVIQTWYNSKVIKGNKLKKTNKQKNKRSWGACDLKLLLEGKMQLVDWCYIWLFLHVDTPPASYVYTLATRTRPINSK